MILCLTKYVSVGRGIVPLQILVDNLVLGNSINLKDASVVEKIILLSFEP